MEHDEQESIKTLIENCNRNIELARSLNKLKNAPEFKELFEEIFIKQGKYFLWENIKRLEEAEMLNKGSTSVSVNDLKEELKARLIFERFMNQVQFDAEDAEEILKQLEEENNAK